MKLSDYIVYYLEKYKWLFVYYKLYSIFDDAYIVSDIIREGKKVLFISTDDEKLNKIDKFINHKIYEEPSIINNLEIRNSFTDTHDLNYKKFDYIIFSLSDNVFLENKDMTFFNNYINTKILISGYSKPHYSVYKNKTLIENFKHITIPENIEEKNQLLKKFYRKQKLNKLFNEERTSI